jgi:hypothetical protein
MRADGGGGGGCGGTANEYSCAHGAQINFGDPTTYLTYSMMVSIHGTDMNLKISSHSPMKLLQKQTHNKQSCA